MEIIQKSINYLKSLTAETISHAKSGHTGSAIGASTMLFSLFKDHLVFNPADTRFLNRDRFVLSSGHTSAMYYSLLHMFGYDISMEDMKQFRTIGSKTPGHPEYNLNLGFETSAGPLGQGVANAVGLAIAQSIFAENFNTKDIELFNNRTYCFAGDGCIMEGVAVEACAIAGTLKLGNLVLLYDDNNITIDGTVDITSTDNTAQKFEAMGWNVVLLKQGQDYAACTKTLAQIKNSNKPTIIIFKTIIGEGTSKAGTSAVHAYPLPEAELAEFKQKLFAPESFFIPEDVYSLCKNTVQKNQKIYHDYTANIARYKTQYPDKYKELSSIFASKNINFNEILNTIKTDPATSGRDISGKVLNLISTACPELVGGAADVAASTKAFICDGGSFSYKNRLGKNIHFGIREHAMGSICNGIALYANTPVFDSTFLAFSNYMMPALKMRSMMQSPNLSIFTHDSVDVGEDGPSHQPIEQLPQLRRLLHYNVFRPATKAEMVAAFKVFFETRIPSAIIASKNQLADFELSTIEAASKGGYIVFETKNKPTIEIIATGREVALAVDVAYELKDHGVRVISMPCESIFDKLSKSEKNKIRLQSAKLRVVIEASNDPIWYKYVGENGLIIGVYDYQSSGKSADVYKAAGFETSAILKQINNHLK